MLRMQIPILEILERVTRLVCISAKGQKLRYQYVRARIEPPSTGLRHLIVRDAVTTLSIKKDRCKSIGLFNGAGDEARTRYLHLGKVALYRMSYTREEQSLL